MVVQLVWGCNPVKQFEQAWVKFLLEPSLHSLDGTVLVESGLLRLERSPSPQRLNELNQARLQRIAELDDKPFVLIHLSDEEGLDADYFYPQLPSSCQIWRNFFHPRFTTDPRVRSFPIGPRDLFLADDEVMAGISSSSRPFPWAFMGTLWASGSRTVAVSHFLRALPQGFFYGGKRFGMGLPLEHYRERMMQSVFALAPEGDRHLDTFRLWESLCCGCIPLLVDHGDTADALLGHGSPVPVFAGWPQALDFAQHHLHDPKALDDLQLGIQSWWQGVRQTLQRDFQAGFCL